MSSKWLPSSLKDVCTPAKIYVALSVLTFVLHKVLSDQPHPPINPVNIFFAIVWFLILIRICNEKCVKGSSLSMFLVLLPYMLLAVSIVIFYL